VRWQTKPIERRSLYVPSKSNPQGVLEMWVDIMKPEVASAFPADDVSLPPTQVRYLVCVFVSWFTCCRNCVW